MKRICIIVYLIFVSFVFSNDPRPNVLIFVVDDLGYGDLGFSGSTLAETEALDTFASESINFTNAYAASAHCSPSRAALITGQYPARLHITSWIGGEKATSYDGLALPVQQDFLSEASYTLGEFFRDQGYKTVQIGKWHIGAEHVPIESHGFDYVIGHAFGASPGATAKWYGPYPSIRDLDAPSTEYITDRLTSEAINFIQNHADEPFFMMFQHYDVHGPITAPEALVQKYVDLGRPRTNALENAVYLAMKEAIDISFGLVVDTLKELGIYENTIIIFTSDNGGVSHRANNGNLKLGKKWLYEGGVRVPLLMRAPGVSLPSYISSEPVSGIDFFPTLVELTSGINALANYEFDGKSLVPLLRGNSLDGREALFWHSPQLGFSGGTIMPQGSVRMGKWKLIHYYGDLRVPELYDLENDPSEANNLASNEPEIVNQMSALLKQHLTNVSAQQVAVIPEEITLSSRAEILESVNNNSPVTSGVVPPDYTNRIGITHYGGRYHLSDKPFLEEGMENIHAMGFRTAKLWLSARADQMERGYYFNSNWPAYDSSTTLVDVASHPSVHKVFSMDFDTIMLEVNTRRGEEWRVAPNYGTDEYFNYLEDEFYNLSKHLLETYADQEITFILHNWAGDWMLQNKGSEGFVEWGIDPTAVPSDIDNIVEGMIRYFNARQAGVTRARADVTETLATVSHAIKINQLWENIEHSFPDWETTLKIPTDPSLYAYPSVLTHIVPQVEADLVVCAAYETKDDHPVKLWRMIEIMQSFTPPSDLYGDNNVAIGELGYRDNIPLLSEEAVRDYWDKVLGVVFAKNLPHCVFWQLYGNEAVNESGTVIPTGNQDYYGVVFPEDAIRGFWFLRPDGRLSSAGNFFLELLPAGESRVIGRDGNGNWNDSDVWRINNQIELELSPDRNDRINLTSKVNGTVKLTAGPVSVDTLRVGCYQRSENNFINLDASAPILVGGLLAIGSHATGGNGHLTLSTPLVSHANSLNLGSNSLGSLSIKNGGVLEVASGGASIGSLGTITITDGLLEAKGALTMAAGSRINLFGDSQIVVKEPNDLLAYISDGNILGENLAGNIRVESNGTNTTLSADLKNIPVNKIRMSNDAFILDIESAAEEVKVTFSNDLKSGLAGFNNEIQNCTHEGQIVEVPFASPYYNHSHGFFRVLAK